MSSEVSKKRGRPRREGALVVGGDDLVCMLASGLEGVVACERRVSEGEADDVREGDVLREGLERGLMCVADKEERKRVRDLEKAASKRERDALKRDELSAERLAAKQAKIAAKEAAKQAKIAANEAAKQAKIDAKEAAKAQKLKEKEEAKEAAKAAKEQAKADAKAAKEQEKAAAKAAKEQEKADAKAVKAQEKAAKNADKKATKKRKTAAPELLAAVSLSREDVCDGELAPQAFLVESEGSADVPMMKQPSTGYEEPMRSGDSFCDP